MFGKKKSKLQISTDRIQSAIKQAVPAKRPRSERESTWAECELSWFGTSGVDGILMDLSETGARVRFVHRSAIPRRVRLVAPRLKVDREAEVVRRDDSDVGLRFIDED